MNPMNWARFNPYGNQHGATEKWPELYQLYEEITPFMVDVNIILQKSPVFSEFISG